LKNKYNPLLQALKKIKMKKLTLLFPIFFAAFFGDAQSVAINNDGTSAAASAMLDVKSTTKGFMMPRVTSAQRGAIVSPALGLLVFDTDTKTIWAYNGSAWTNLSNAGGSGFTLPYDNTVAIAGTAFKLTNSGTSLEGITTGVSSNGVRGLATANGSNGVYGGSTASNGVGVRGESNTGTGMIAYSTSGTGLNVGSISGTGIYTNSLSGLALNVNGNLKIAGGNTNPSNGAVLTSDANGNAVWKDDHIGFSVSGRNSNLASFPAHIISTIYINIEEFNYGNDYVLYTGSTPAFGHSVFVAPKSGVYHFDAALSISAVDPIEYAFLRIKIIRVVNGSAAALYPAATEFLPIIRGGSNFSLAQASFSKDIKLISGDIVTLELYNGSSQLLGFYDHDEVSHFGCHLVFED